MSTDPDPTAQKIHFNDDINPVKSTGYTINRRASLSEKGDDVEADHKKIADEDRNHKKKQASPIPSTKDINHEEISVPRDQTLAACILLKPQNFQ
jgi:hypothetical protein